MMIDPNTEELISCSEAAKGIPGRPNTSTVWRWQQRGVRGIKLESVLVGGKRMTSREAVDRFIAAVNAAADGEQVQPETPAQRQRAIESAEREAEALGV
jgi:hypothetical protein